jgi:hypothetical protein
MGTFMTRVELHHADEDDYEALHSAMETEGFERIITSDQGIKYHLPTAEYYRTANLTRQQVLDSAMRAAATTGKSHAAVVTESLGVIWNGLTKVQ